jgi:endonuclease/exonuclease/phosphatase family metal-dependent hydrolase
MQRSGSLRVATLNLWGIRGDWNARRTALMHGFRQLNPDIIAFEESIVTDEYDQVRDLLNSDYHVVHHGVRQADGMGISIASRWKPEAVHELDLQLSPRTADFPCTALLAEVQTPEPIGALLFVNHFPSWKLDFEYEREQQAVRTARLIEDVVAGRKMHVVLVGDLDAEPNAASIRFWSGRQSLDSMSVCYRDAWESAHPADAGHTFTPDNLLMKDPDWPFRRIDYIFVRCGLHGGPTLGISACSLIF